MIIVKQSRAARWHISKSIAASDILQRSLCGKILAATYTIEIDEIDEDNTAVCKRCKGTLVKEQAND